MERLLKLKIKKRLLNKGFTTLELIFCLVIIQFSLCLVRPINFNYINYEQFKLNMLLAQRQAMHYHQKIKVNLDGNSYYVDQVKLGEYQGSVFSFNFNAKGNISMAKSINYYDRIFTFYLGSGKGDLQ